MIMMKFICKILVFSPLLFSSTMAKGMRRLQEDQTLGAAFLEAVTEGSDGSTMQASYSRDGSLSADVKSEFMTTLSEELTEICSRLGRTEYLSSYSDSETGETQYFSLTCRFEGDNTTYDMAYDEMVKSIQSAEPVSTSMSSNVYQNYYGPNMAGQTKGLEMLIQMATTIEEVMLVVPTWQNAFYNDSPHEGSSINVNINKYYDYDYSHNMTGDDDMWMHMNDDAMMGPPIEESDDEGI